MAQSYEDINLDPLLKSIDSLLNNKDFVSGYQIDSTYDQGGVTQYQLQNLSVGNAQLGTAVIGTANIGTLSFNEISGGTAILGGTTNGDGLLIVNDEGGSERVKLDKEGIKVTGGSIIVEDDGGGTIIDATGLVSTANFESGGTTASNQLNYTGTTYTDVANMTLTTSNFSRSRNVIVLFTAQINIDDPGNNNFDDFINIIGRVDGTNDESMFITKRAYRSGADYTAQNVFSSHSMHLFRTMGTGVHTIKAQARISRNVGTATGHIFRRSMSYVALGV